MIMRNLRSYYTQATYLTRASGRQISKAPHLHTTRAHDFHSPRQHMRGPGVLPGPRSRPILRGLAPRGGLLTELTDGDVLDLTKWKA